MGPWSYARHLVSGPRLPFTAAYFGSIGLTLYFAIGVSLFVLILVSFFVNHQVHTHTHNVVHQSGCTIPGKRGILHSYGISQYYMTCTVTPAHIFVGLLSITPYIIGFCATTLLQRQNLAPLQYTSDTQCTPRTVSGTGSDMFTIPNSYCPLS